MNFSPNEMQKNVTIPLINNDVQEVEKWFLANLSLPVEMDGVVLDAALTTTNVTIVDDDCKLLDNVHVQGSAQDNESGG